ncbi:hypothetical protein RclHR1_00070028 [Rhizophagus clarus]|uniref:Uncharacterized protein n=1 Tax=Rhizophagus clarus TaxID=94130 RepID=A0A2Z6RWH2_9GLOM|nr:hypothetical protein RclHR1_00070028 [Rhizophagus clarus]
MSESLQILSKELSSQLYVLVLNLETNVFFKIKVSSPHEIIERGIERKYKSPLKNAYMIFMTDCSKAFKAAKSEKKFRQNSECFKDFSSLWKKSPKEVKDEYERVFENYKNLNKDQNENKPFHFVHCNPHEPTASSSTPQQTFTVDDNLLEVENPSSRVQLENTASISMYCVIK